MGLSRALFGVFLLFPSVIAHRTITETYYLLAVTSQAVGGTTETLCVTVNPIQEVSVEVSLEFNGNTVTVLAETVIDQHYYNCVPFQVPVVSVESVASISIQIKGCKVQSKTTKIRITPSKQLIFIQTDKPIYKPGQTVNFRIVSLDFSFLIYSQTFTTIEVQDPNSNRIGQWLNVDTQSGIVDLSFPLSSQATKGVYTITVWDKKNNPIKQSCEVKDYVLPTFEVTVQIASVITILDTNTTLKVCAKYTYGKPVNGKVTATVCHNSFNYWWFPTDLVPSDICQGYIMMTDKTGCGQTDLNLNEYILTDSRYQSEISVQAQVEETGTGVILTASGSSSITSVIRSLSFEDSPATFKLGMVYEGKIVATDSNSSPVTETVVILSISYASQNSFLRLVTDNNGIADFSIQTHQWGLNQVSLQAQFESTYSLTEYKEYQLTPYDSTAYLSLEPFYSKSLSFITLNHCSTPFSCDKKAVIEAQYMIHNHALRPHQRNLCFYYMVMSKGHAVQQGHLLESIHPGREHRGTLFLSLENMLELPPVAQVVLYILLPNGEVVADSMNYPIQLCLTNQVSLNFPSPSELPGNQISLTLEAASGSLCSVRAIDQSLLLLKPEKELSANAVFSMLPFQTLSGYPYNIVDEDSLPCFGGPAFMGARFVGGPMFGDYSSNNGKVDVYGTFENVGIKILTNAIIKKPITCFNSFDFLDGFVMPLLAMQTMDAVAPVAFERTVSASPVEAVVTIRKYFPETWIWDLVPVGQSGVMALNKTVPDSITTWQADAFCTSPIGFGVAPSAELTAFQPFFVSLTMPTSIIRGEVFTLKATIFSYLQSCMMVSVSLTRTNQFSVQGCKHSNTKCLCPDESLTFSWTITALVLGEVSISVTAEAVQSSQSCGDGAVVVPEKGRIDTVITTLLVQAEGTTQYKSYNELLCPANNIIDETVSLELPAVFVDGSATASVSVLGDLMGRALQNLASLLAMPYGCGEQNMILFAPNIFILEYLESTNQLTPEIRSTAETYLISGYQRELTYKHTDGSYSAFGMSDASGNTWLTAFVMKSFGGAMGYIFIDQVFVDNAKVWLGQQQQSNGCFASVGQLFHTDLKGGVNDEVTLSAYITAAMLELSYTIEDPVVSGALVCLRKAYTQVNSTYAQALLFYTFTLAGDQGMRNTLILELNSKAIVSGGGRHWSRVNDGSVPDSLEVEMTSYVLLALMSGPPLPGFNLGYSISIVHWLSQQQNSFGGFASTQDTVVALQALAKYSLATYSPAGAVNVTVKSPSGLNNTFSITQSNRLLYQESQLQEVPGDYSVKAEGTGCVYVQFTLRYNIPPPPDHTSFSISASASGDCTNPKPSLEVTITVSYNGQRLETNMVVIKVKLLSGFSGDTTSVTLVNGQPELTDGAVKNVDQADGEVVIYLNKLDNGEEKVYTLTIVQDIAVVNLRPAVVKVFDYYETGDSAVTAYTSPCT